MNKEQLFEIFNQIIADKELAKRALNNPAEVFAELGLKVCDADTVNKYFYAACPELKKHFLAAVAGKAEENALLECDSPECIACIAGITTVASAAIVAAMAAFPEDMPLIEALAELVGLDAEVVEEIIKEAIEQGLDVTGVVRKICVALDGC